MSVHVTSWVLRESPVGGNDRLVLLSLADKAGDDGDDAYPSLATLAHEARCSEDTARRSLRRLAAGGHISDEGYGPRGTRRWRVVMASHPAGGSKLQGVANGAEGGGIATPPEPSLEPSTSRNESARASSSDVVPDDFPAELRPHARRVMAVLRDVAARRGARKVTARAVALTVAARPRKPLVTAAHDCAAWIEDHPEVACRDVVARYRRWLDREPDLQGLERLDANGVPTSAPVGRPAGVTPIRRPSTGAAGLAERTAIRRAQIEALGGRP